VELNLPNQIPEVTDCHRSTGSALPKWLCKGALASGAACGNVQRFKKWLLP
jgi:hypothetical protein